MKKCLSIFLSVLMLMSAIVLPGAASDYTGHWAAETIALLVADGIVSGDENGNVNPDANITRAEFVKVINKAFNYTGKGTDNFPDVDPNAWYASDMAIAKASGYIQGDAEGNANPESNITRIEVCVILARVLNLDTADTTLNFSDADQIADWGKGAVAALVKIGYISGYPDGTFQGENSITRAESFSVIGRYKKQSTPDKNETGDIASMGGAGTVVSGGSISGGGGASTKGGTLSTPSVTLKEETETISWSKNSNASSYNVEVTIGDETEIVSVKENSCVLTDIVDEMTMSSEDSVFEVAIRVKAVATKSGYESSAYSKQILYTKKYPSIEVPTFTVETKNVAGKSRTVIAMAEQQNAAGYAGRFLIDGVENDTMSYDATEKIFIIPDTSVIGNGVGKVEIKAISGLKPDYRDSEYVSKEIAYTVTASSDGPGTGTIGDPYKLRTKEDFELVRNNPSAHFVVMNDIDLGNFEPLPTFLGTFRSEGGPHILTVNISKDADNTGLFSVLNGGATVSDIILAGSVSGKGYVGGIVGLMSDGVIENCINTATITGTTYVGGIVGTTGYTPVGKGTIRNCLNAGAIIGNGSDVAGIIGYGHASIYNSANIASVQGKGVYVGGIAGMTYNPIYESYNTGDVTNLANGTTGGIAGGVRQSSSPIQDCFNTGTVTGVNMAGGILGGFWNASSHGAITRCYNAGEVVATATAPIVYKNQEVPVTCTNSLYLDESGTADAENGTEPITSAQLQDAENALVKALMSDKFIFDDASLYPILKNTPYYGANGLKYFTQDLAMEGIYENNSMVLTWDAVADPEVLGLEITVVDNYNFKTVLEKQLVDAAETTLTVPGCKAQNNYGIIVRAKYGDTVYATEQNYEVIPYSANTLKAPVMNPVAEGDTLVSWNTVDNAGSYMLYVELDNIDEEIPVDGTSYDLESWIAEKTEDDPKPSVSVTVSVQAIAGSADYEDSPLSASVTVIRTLPTLALPTVTVKNMAVSGKNRLVIAIDKDPDARDYIGKFMVGSSEDDTMEWDSEKYLFIIPDTSVIGDAKAYVEIEAVSGNEGLLNSEILKVDVEHTPVPVSGADCDGSLEKPYQLKNKEDFELVRTNPSAHFVVMNDIDLGAYTSIPLFTGSITSVEGKTCILTLTGSNGLFAIVGSADAKASISNLAVAGTITGGGANTGAFAGQLINGTIDGCINTASITATGNYVGGIVGLGYDGVVAGSTITNCYNTGKIDVTGSQVGGIIGRCNIPVSACGNLGTVRAQTIVAGIAGLTAANVTSCYNAGMIVGHTGGRSGAIIGQWAANLTVSSCFNTGLVLEGHDTRGGGLVGPNYSANKSLTITDCYNASVLSKRAAQDTAGVELPYPIVNNVATNVTITLSNCWYVSDNNVDDGLSGSTLVTKADLANATTMQSLLDAGYHFDATKCDYPILATPEYYKEGDLTMTPTVSFAIEIDGNVAGDQLDLTLAPSAVPGMTGIEFIVYDAYDFSVLKTEVLAADATSASFSGMTAGSTYIVSFKAVLVDGYSSETTKEFTASLEQ